MKNVMNNMADKVLLITGGTGSFGNAVISRLLDSDVHEIRVLSRDEKKQEDMRKRYDNVKLKFYLGDVRDRTSVDLAMGGVDYVFHAAALKQVPSCEFFPLEAVKTNILGTANVIDSAISLGAKRVVCLSTDKAVYPINAMGLSKGLMEKVATAKALSSNSTIICVTRYGNVMASRGSVIPLFVKQIEKGVPITITDPNMTRFMMTLHDAVDLVMFAFNNGNQGDVFVQKSPAATIEMLAQTIAETFGMANYPTVNIGTRHGEKLYEVLLAREEVIKSVDLGDYFCVPADTRDLNYNLYTSSGQIVSNSVEEYTSHNTHRLNSLEMKNLLAKVNLEYSF